MVVSLYRRQSVRTHHQRVPRQQEQQARRASHRTDLHHQMRQSVPAVAEPAAVELERHQTTRLHRTDRFQPAAPGLVARRTLRYIKSEPAAVAVVVVVVVAVVRTDRRRHRTSHH
ncbi:unnamed protein product [Somion occarium]|uniref:Uncharacterized protein n=1 Tax=Somion occarium TaxID=3059160 RepID=A0ABP1CWQ7_9APHY